MPSRAAPLSKPTWRTLADRKRKRIDVTIRVITPVFGGGVYIPQAGETVGGHTIPENDTLPGRFREPDDVTPIRSAAVRGMLRFWWRACVAHRFATIDKLRDAEEQLWGAASTEMKPCVGAVSLIVTLRGDGDTWEPFEVFEPRQGERGSWNPRAIDGKKKLAYGAFPLQAPGSQAEETPSGRLHRFRKEAVVSVEYPLPPPGGIDDVALALDAWLAFGGFGGRTRRGFGAVECVSRLVDPQEVIQQVRTIPGTPLAGVPSLKDARLKTRKTRPAADRDPLEALADALERLRLFRQGQQADGGVGRRSGVGRKASRSLWPEPETIRWTTMDSQRGHDDRLFEVEKFPRAVFGMPIIFHFQDRRGEPEVSTLKPGDKERMASPLVLRPYRVSANAYGALALVLHDPDRAAMRVVLDHEIPKPVAAPTPRSPTQPRAVTSTYFDTTLSMTEARKITALAGNPDVLGAFLTFFAK
jgi:CRISPR-associated protein Cmr1